MRRFWVLLDFLGVAHVTVLTLYLEYIKNEK